MTAWRFLCTFPLQSKERKGPASTSEMKRWVQNQALHINAEPVTWDEDLDFPLTSVVLFPKNDRARVTLL